MELTLTAVFEEVPQEHGGGYAAWVEELPGANTQGDTLEEARENLLDAVHELLQARKDVLGETNQVPRVIREKLKIPAAWAH
jgi:predicted RNase H-like HicB family nuclease